MPTGLADFNFESAILAIIHSLSPVKACPVIAAYSKGASYEA
jgi:hypothetical protein